MSLPRQPQEVSLNLHSSLRALRVLSYAFLACWVASSLSSCVAIPCGSDNDNIGDRRLGVERRLILGIAPASGERLLYGDLGPGESRFGVKRILGAGVRALPSLLSPPLFDWLLEPLRDWAPDDGCGVMGHPLIGFCKSSTVNLIQLRALEDDLQNPDTP